MESCKNTKQKKKKTKTNANLPPLPLQLDRTHPSIWIAFSHYANDMVWTIHSKLNEILEFIFCCILSVTIDKQSPDHQSPDDTVYTCVEAYESQLRDIDSCMHVMNRIQ